jgi:putative phosphoesterase
MKIGFISDLHIDRNHKVSAKEYLTMLRDIIVAKNLETLVIGGDISNHYTTTFKFVEELQKQAKIPVYFIPGNHDFWEEKEARKNTRKIYEHYQKHPQSLVESPLQLNEDYTLVGHPGWYNHAVYDKEQFSSEDVEHGKFRWAYWQDKLRMDWEMSDQDVSKRFANIIEKDLEEVTTENIILQTHVVTVPEFTMPMPHRIFDFFNAYMATNDLKHVHKEFPITHQFMGHVHFREKIIRDRTEFITNSLGYRREWWSEDLAKEVQRSLVILTL